MLVFGLCTFAGGLRWKEQWFNSGGQIHLITQLGSLTVSSRDPGSILSIVDIRGRGSTACRCDTKLLGALSVR